MLAAARLTRSMIDTYLTVSAGPSCRSIASRMPGARVKDRKHFCRNPEDCRDARSGQFARHRMSDRALPVLNMTMKSPSPIEVSSGLGAASVRRRTDAIAFRLWTFQTEPTSVQVCA